MSAFWSIYDALTAALPDEALQDVLCGLHWFAVRGQSGVGLAMTPGEGPNALPDAGHYTDATAGFAKLSDLARLSRSWNFAEAALGLAAINAGFNSPATVTKAFATDHRSLPTENIFDYLVPEMRGRKVAVIGHFAGLEKLREICTLSILERQPLSGDMPDPACEAILPEQDIVIATATTLINKTLPRLMELSRGARFILAGPSTPLTPVLFDYGIDTLAGLVIEDPATVWRTIGQGGKHQLFGTGARMVTISRRKAAAA